MNHFFSLSYHTHHTWQCIHQLYSLPIWEHSGVHSEAHYAFSCRNAACMHTLTSKDQYCLLSEGLLGTEDLPQWLSDLRQFSVLHVHRTPFSNCLVLQLCHRRPLRFRGTVFYHCVCVCTVPLRNWIVPLYLMHLYISKHSTEIL